MSRARSQDKSIPISVALPGSLVTRLDQELSYQASRSKYVAIAIKNRLDEVQSSAIEDASSRTLMAALHGRTDISNNLKTILQTILMN